DIVACRPMLRVRRLTSRCAHERDRKSQKQEKRFHVVPPYAILKALMLAPPTPALAASISPLALLASRTLIRRFPAGDAIYPDKEIAITSLAAGTVLLALAITVVPSQSLTSIRAAPAVSVSVTVPETNHVPVDPWLMLGPSKNV